MRDKMTWQEITRFTRCGSYSKKIKCPLCDHVHEVWHFGWTASACPKCGEWVEKTDYTVLAKVREVKA